MSWFYLKNKTTLATMFNVLHTKNNVLHTKIVSDKHDTALTEDVHRDANRSVQPESAAEAQQMILRMTIVVLYLC